MAGDGGSAWYPALRLAVAGRAVAYSPFPVVSVLRAEPQPAARMTSKPIAMKNATIIPGVNLLGAHTQTVISLGTTLH